MNKKAIEPITIAIIIGAIILGSIALIPGVANSIGTLFTGEIKSCDDTPFDKDCFCEVEFNKGHFDWLGGVGTKYFCEKIELFLDPEDSNFETDALNFAKSKLNELHLGCDTIECSSEIGEVEINTIQETSGNREALLECRGATRIWWGIRIDLEDGNVIRSECINFEEPIEVEGWTREQFKQRCEDTSSPYCNKVFSASLDQCSTHEIFPASSCLSGSQCTKGVGYAYELTDETWIGCGARATEVWLSQ